MSDSLHGSAEFIRDLDSLERGGFMTGGRGFHLGGCLDPRTATATYIPFGYNGQMHGLTLAPTRSGKGRDSLIPTLLTDPSSFIVLDPKGQLAAVTAKHRAAMGQRVFCLNPFGLHSEAPWHLPNHRYNPLAILDPKSPSFYADIEAQAHSMIVITGTDQHWSDAARDLVTGLTIDAKTREGGTGTFGAMRKLLSMPHEVFLAELQRNVMKGDPVARARVSRFAVPQSGEIQSVLATAITQTSFLDDPLMTHSLGASDFSFGELKHKPTTVYVIVPAQYMDAFSRWTRLIIQSAIRELFATIAGHPVVMMIDEAFNVLGGARLSMLESVLAQAAGHGLRVWTVFQDLPQLRRIYGDMADSFMANAGMVQFFTPNDQQTAGYLSTRLGTYTERVESASMGELSVAQYEGGFTGIQKSHNVAARPLAYPFELYGFPPDKSLVFLKGASHAFELLRAPYFVVPMLRERMQPDPFYPNTPHGPQGLHGSQPLTVGAAPAPAQAPAPQPVKTGIPKPDEALVKRKFGPFGF